MKEKVSCMGIVIAESQGFKRVLMLRDDEGSWVFPKGHVEEGETYIQTAIREIREETGIKVYDNHFLGKVDEFRYYFDVEKAVKVIKVFLFKVNVFKTIKFNKREGFINGKWFGLNEGVETLQHDDAREALKKAIEMLRAKE